MCGFAWPAASIFSAMAVSCGTRRASSTTSWPFSAKYLRERGPDPDDAPVISTTGLAGPAEIRSAGKGLSISMPEIPRLRHAYHAALRLRSHSRDDTAPFALPVCKYRLPDSGCSGV
jgi:hypothetical protein